MANTEGVLITIGILDKLATYLELILGVQQCSSMLELFIMIKITLLPIENVSRPTTIANKSSYISHSTDLRGTDIFGSRDHTSLTEITKSVVSISDRENKLVNVSKRARHVLIVTISLLLILMVSFIFIYKGKVSPAYNLTTIGMFFPTGIGLVVILVLLIYTI